MPQIVKLYVEKGRTTQIDDTHWNKTKYGLEADVSDVTSEDALEKLRLDLGFKIDDWLQQAGYPPEAMSALGIPNIDIAELDACEWQTYKKEPAKPGQAAWIKNPAYFTQFEAPPVLLELVEALKRTKDEKLVLGDMTYSFSGKGDMKDAFVSRKPAKRESVK